MNAAGFSYMRIPLGASDFSASGKRLYSLVYLWRDVWSSVAYSFDDTSGDTSFNNFDINRAPSYLFSVLKDIQSLNNSEWANFNFQLVLNS